NLGDADLMRANLMMANLERVNLVGTELREANLKGANLFAASVKSERRSRGWWSLSGDGSSVGTVIRTDFSNAKGLNQDQLNVLQGDSETIIPNHLERPAHWPVFEAEEEVPEGKAQDITHSASPDPFCFLSYAHQDRPLITDISNSLTAENLLLWWDQYIEPGDAWRESIAKNLEAAKVVITFWTKDSTQSKAVIEEASIAQRSGKLVHVRLDDAPLPYGFAETQYLDLRDWDGTPSDLEFRKLIQTLKDRLDPPTLASFGQRMNNASPVAFKARGKKLTPVDTPPNTAPPISNQDDLDARLDGLRHRLDEVINLVSDPIAYQMPQEALRRLNGIRNAACADPVTWYGLDDARDAMAQCRVNHDAARSWNSDVHADVLRIEKRIVELQPLLQPKQVPAGEEGAKPVVTDPIVREADVPAASELAKAVDDFAQTEDAVAVLDDASLDLLKKATGAIHDGTLPAPGAEEGRYKSLRRGVRGLVYALGGIIAAVSGGVAVNVLTAPEAAKTLAIRLQPILDRLLGFFF
ncbi:MAG: TIR domain-containing protein, partial [Pseudomonadota bacterium]